MATLTSCSFSAVNFQFHSSSIFRERVGFHVFESRKLKGNLCFLCREIISKDVSRERFFKIRCFSGNNNDGNHTNNDGDIRENNSNNNNNSSSSKEATVTTASPPEEAAAEQRSTSNDSPSSVSSKPPNIAPLGSAYSDFQIDSFKLMELLGPEKVDPSDVKLIKDKLFGYSTFWVTKEEPFGDLGEGILFLGNLRGKREDVFTKLQTQLTEIMGDKYNLFMVEEPNSEAPDPRGGPRVSFGLLRKEVSEPGPTTLWQYVIAVLLFLLTIGSSVELGIASQINRLPPEIVKYFTDPNAVEPPDMELLYPFVDSALPLAYDVLGVLMFHEVGHFLSAFPKKVKLSIPFFIPNITLGSFGAITQFKSILPDRSTKVDISLAGPFAGAALSFSMFAVGLLLSSNPDVSGDLVQVPSTLFQGSLLLGLISRATLGYAAMHAATVSIHPLVIAGWCGLTTTAFNTLPVGCLDGGRAVQGAFGKGALVGFGLSTYTLLGLGVLGGQLSLPWGLYVLICQRTPEKPCLNDVTEVGTWRKTAVTLAIFLVVLILLPLWDELAEELALIFPWLTPQELATISLTCKTLHQVAHSITLHRSLDASRSFENLPIPFHNTVDQYPYVYFIYTPSQIIPSSSFPSLKRQFWGSDSLSASSSQSIVQSGSSLSHAGLGCAHDSMARLGTSCVSVVDESGCECQRCEKVSEDNVIGCPCMELEGSEGVGIMTECGPSCGCGLQCGNRLSQGGIRVKLKIVRDARKGWGLYAAQLIQRGQFVCEYAGELLTTNEARRRHQIYDQLASDGHFSSAILVVREHLPSGKACLRINIDATKVGNVARFINHSCDGGNLSTVLVRSSGVFLPHLCFFASKDIKEDEELTFSYGEIRVRSKGLKCYCGSSCCFGTLPSEHT
ncbi:hypothetical protein DITRI_Ditri06bG0122900 [Diplodiscus trichospermus]